jgi:hypothetical protein
MDANLTGDDGRKFTTTPLGMDGPVLQGILIDEVIEVAFQLIRDFGRSPSARAVDEPPRPLVRKPKGRIRKLERVGDGLQALPFDHVAHGWRIS